MIPLAATFDEKAVKYVAAAYAAVWLVTLVYVLLIRAKLTRLEREVREAERTLATSAGREPEAVEPPARVPS